MRSLPNCSWACLGVSPDQVPLPRVAGMQPPWLGLREVPVRPCCKGTLPDMSPFLLLHGLSVHVCSLPTSCFSFKPWTHLVSESRSQCSSLRLNCPGIDYPSYPSAIPVGPSWPPLYHQCFIPSSMKRAESMMRIDPGTALWEEKGVGSMRIALLERWQVVGGQEDMQGYLDIVIIFLFSC